MEDNLLNLGFSLAELVSRNTVGYVGSKMKIAKEKKDLQSQSIVYEEIINELLQDKSDLALIARNYKESYEQITISDEDIDYLHNTLRGAIGQPLTEVCSQAIKDKLKTSSSIQKTRKK